MGAMRAMRAMRAMGVMGILNWAQAASLRQRNPHPRSPSPKERGAVRSSAVWGCKENFELGTSYKLAPAGGINRLSKNIQ